MDGDCFVIPNACQRHPFQPLPIFAHSSELGLANLVKVCGETGIRTPETLLKFTRFPGVPLKPLEHLSLAHMRFKSNSATKLLQIIELCKFFCNYFLFCHILCIIFAYIKKKLYLCAPNKTYFYVYHRHRGWYRLG